MIAVVIPTIAGREELLARTVDAYRAEPGVRIYLARDYPTIGDAWNAGAYRALVDDPLLVHLAADDVIPAPGALQAGALSLAVGVYPSPRIMNPDGSLHSCGSLGGGMLLPESPTGTVAGTSGFPILYAEHLAAMLPLPSIHYYADDYIGWAARTFGLVCRVAREYAFTHLEGSVGRGRMVDRSGADRAAMLAAVGERGLLNTRPAQYDPGETIAEG